MITLLAMLSLGWAQDTGGNDAHGRPLVPSDGDPQDPIWGYRAERQLPGSFGGMAVAQLANAPLILVTSDASGETREDVLDNVLGVTIGGQYALHERVALGLSAPIWLASAGLEGANGATFGDARLSMPVGLVLPGEQGEGFGLAVVPLLDLPTGAEGAWLGNAGVAGGGLVSTSYGAGKLLLVGDIGVATASQIEVGNLTGGPKLLADASAAWMVSPDLAVRLEARFDPTLSSNDVALAGSPAEIGLNARHRSGEEGLSLLGGATTALTSGAGAATWRLFLGVGYTGRKHWVHDTDGDGLSDDVDACILEAETVNKWKDDDGCPDGLATLTVTVRDDDGVLAGAEVRAGKKRIGVTDAEGRLVLTEQLPESALTLVSDFDKHLAAAPQDITLVEGEQQLDIHLPFVPGKLHVRAVDKKTQAPLDGTLRFGKAVGAPGPTAIGADGSTVSVKRGDWKAFVEADGYRLSPVDVTILPGETTEVLAQLERAMVKVQAQEIQILDKVFFERAKADIMPASFDLLTEVATVLLANPQLKKVEVQGHTDSDGNDAYNLNLSQARVDSVMSFLVERGVEADRLVAKGYGETMPMVPNTSKANKATNRRVQFIILEQEAVVIEVPVETTERGEITVETPSTQAN
ncbi:MAG: OmpA family protein [Deltaproteobacteria bacterium]|nr:OmpA family protein [Deltaproteobacteria bacterium]